VLLSVRAVLTNGSFLGGDGPPTLRAAIARGRYS